jgi:hypothetical protein
MIEAEAIGPASLIRRKKPPKFRGHVFGRLKAHGPDVDLSTACAE